MFPYSFFVSLSRSKFYTTPSILCRNLVDLHLGIDLAKLDLIKKWSFANIPVRFLSSLKALWFLQKRAGTVKRRGLFMVMKSLL